MRGSHLDLTPNNNTAQCYVDKYATTEFVKRTVSHIFIGPRSDNCLTILKTESDIKVEFVVDVVDWSNHLLTLFAF